MERPLVELLPLQLPHRHRSGTDLMLKHILLDPVVINMVVETILGPYTKDQYSPRPTEWPNHTISDICIYPIQVKTISLLY